MSAFICSKRHIATISNEFAKRFDENRVKIANILYSENVKSVDFRYGTETKITKFRVIKDSEVMSLEDKSIKNMQLYKLCCSLHYQSCEHDGWGKSKAKKLLDKLEKSLLDDLFVEYNLKTEEEIRKTHAWANAKWSI